MWHFLLKKYMAMYKPLSHLEWVLLSKAFCISQARHYGNNTLLKWVTSRSGRYQEQILLSHLYNTGKAAFDCKRETMRTLSFFF